jgi:hypothetical protein
MRSRCCRRSARPAEGGAPTPPSSAGRRRHPGTLLPWPGVAVTASSAQHRAAAVRASRTNGVRLGSVARLVIRTFALDPRTTINPGPWFRSWIGPSVGGRFPPPRPPSISGSRLSWALVPACVPVLFRRLGGSGPPSPRQAVSNCASQSTAQPYTNACSIPRTEEVRGSNPLTSTPNLAGQGAVRFPGAALSSFRSRAGAASAHQTAPPGGGAEGYGAAVRRGRDAASAPPKTARIALRSGTSTRRKLRPPRLSSTS